MTRVFLVLGTVALATFGVSYAWSSGQQGSDKSKSTAEESKTAAESKSSGDDGARVNPVKSSPEGLAEARKVYAYDCAMCHGDKGDGKGDVVESMKLEMRDWHDPATLAGKTDGEIFSIITKGKGKMMAEGERVPEKLRWNLVNLVRAMAAKSSDQKAATAAPAP
jgi:mono/diheme cytochrome c family protein